MNRKLFKVTLVYAPKAPRVMDKLADRFVAPTAAPIAILGVPFDCVTTIETIEMIEQMILSRRPHYLATANVDFLVHAAKDVELRRILFDAHLVLCDGTPLLWASRLLGNALPERVAGSDLVPLLLKLAAEKGYRPFLLGASADSLEAAVRRARELYPKLEFAGYYSPPFKNLLEMDHDDIRERICRSEADILFVAFGCPKQEKWINMHYRALGVPVSVGVGGTIDFLAGKLARAPRWMQKSGTEWIFRLGQEPRRLFQRYASDLVHFTGGIVSQWWRLRKRSPRPATRPTARDPSEFVPFHTVKMPSHLDCEEVQTRQAFYESVIRPDRSCILDLAEVELLDSTGIGLLVRLQKRSRAAGQPLILAQPSEMVRRALDLMQLTEFFTFSPGLAEAEATLKEAGSLSAITVRKPPGSTLATLSWSGELTAANAEEVWVQTMDHLVARALVQRSLTIDLGQLRFIDSTGVGLMLRARKYAARQGLAVTFSNPPPNVLNVLRFSRLEEYLLHE